MIRSLLLGAASVMVLLPGQVGHAQRKQYALESTDGVRLHNVLAQPATLDGKRGLRVTVDSTAHSAVESTVGQAEIDQLARIEGVEFSNGVIEVEVAGAPASGAFAGARGFVGIAFRLRDDMKTYDAFFLRPTNGRAEDQERRNHTTQYISHPDWRWSRLRQETPSRYESYVDLVSNAWTKIRIEVRGQQAKLYVHDQSQPSLIVNGVKSGATAKGGVALWIGAGTVGHFRNLTVTSDTTVR